MVRMKGGKETYYRLLNWDRGQSDAERLAAHILRSEGYDSLDPSHPLGGRDGGKDILCKKDGISLLGAVYFPRGHKGFAEIKEKFKQDYKGIDKNNVDGIVFITNQELTLGERSLLSKIGKKNTVVEIFHLEKITSLLDSPNNYGIRLDFLDIEYTKEEIIALYAARDLEYYEKLDKLNKKLSSITDSLESQVNNLIGYSTGGDSIGYVSFSSYENDCYDHIYSVLFHTQGKYPLYNINIELTDIEIYKNDNNKGKYYLYIPEQGANLAGRQNIILDFSDRQEVTYHISMFARNGIFDQELKYFKVDGKWLLATRVASKGNIVYEYIHRDMPIEKLKWD